MTIYKYQCPKCKKIIETDKKMKKCNHCRKGNILETLSESEGLDA